jgi:tRNA dimethylallyltransferase
LAAVRLPIIVGPTAVGKTALALALRAHWPLEVVSADSRQVYRRLDIGTAKPTRRERERVPHEGVDLIDPGERYSAGRFAEDAERWISGIRLRGKMPVVVGGTGLYVRALVDGLFHEPPLDPDRRRQLEEWLERLGTQSMVRWAARLDPGFKGGGRQRASRAIELALLSGRPLSDWQTRARSASSVAPWYVVLRVPRAVLHHRIQVRADEMVRRGLIEEVAAVLADGVRPGAPGLDGVGIREAVEYLQGQRDRASVAPAVAAASRQYAKRQETWFRHQLAGPTLTLDATRPAEEVAAEIARGWDLVRSRFDDTVEEGR